MATKLLFIFILKSKLKENYLKLHKCIDRFLKKALNTHCKVVHIF